MLILVVVLLVLMAILGTAYLVTAKNDMVASKLYEHNVQIDMLVQGVENMAMGAITDSSYQTVPIPPAMLQHYDDWFTTTTANGVGGPRARGPHLDGIALSRAASPKRPGFSRPAASPDSLSPRARWCQVNGTSGPLLPVAGRQQYDAHRRLPATTTATWRISRPSRTPAGVNASSMPAGRPSHAPLARLATRLLRIRGIMQLAALLEQTCSVPTACERA